MNDQEILNEGYKKIGDNLYQKDQTIFTQYKGQLVDAASLDEQTLRSISKQHYKLSRLQKAKKKDDDIKPLSLINTDIGLVTPAANIDAIMNNMQLFHTLKQKILNDADILYIGSDGKPTRNKKDSTPYIKKSGWRKLALAFNLNCQIIDHEKQKIDDDGEEGGYKWLYYVRVTAPNGRYQDAEGIASSLDRFFTKGGKQKADEVNIMLKAQTVAFNRAISDLIGGGETSAEETSYE